MYLWILVFLLSSSLASTCDSTCGYCSSIACLACNDPTASINGAVCVSTHPAQSPIPPNTNPALRPLYKVSTYSDDTWDAQCSISGKTKSINSAGGIWINNNKSPETCIFSKNMNINYDFSIFGWILSSNAVYLAVNGVQTNNIITVDGGESYKNLNSYFNGPGSYIISLVVFGAGSDPYVRFELDEYYTCMSTCAACNATACILCNDPGATISGQNCISNLPPIVPSSPMWNTNSANLPTVVVNTNTDSSWAYHCTVSGNGQSQVIDYQGFVTLSGNGFAPVIWANNNEYAENCTFTKTVQIGFDVNITASLVTDNIGYVAINGAMTPMFTMNGGQGNYNFDLMNSFSGPGQYLISLVVTNFEGPAGVAFQLQETQTCPITCSECSSATVCTACVNNLVLNGGVCGCDSGFYVNNNQCLACGPTCSTCSSSSTCLTCVNNLDLNNGQCGCNPGTYHNGPDSCHVCNPTCATCSSESTCLTCANNLILNNGQCGCNNHQFLASNNTCIECHSSCATCLNADTCTSCPPLFMVSNGLCVCSAGFSLSSSGICEPCDKSCFTCDASGCLTCVTNLVLSNGHCACGEGTFYTGFSACAPCSDGCAECSGASTCNRCLNNLVLVNGQCGCDSGSYKNATSQCDGCSNSCLQCTDASNCEKCQPGFNLANGVCSPSSPSQNSDDEPLIGQLILVLCDDSDCVVNDHGENAIENLLLSQN